MTILNPYLNFRDNASEAMDFYQSVFGGELIKSTFAEGGMGEEVDADKIMHAHLTSPNGLVLMGSDTPASMDYSGGPAYSISLSGPAEDADELKNYWSKLSDGGKVTMPLDMAPWGDYFGMCDDRFGVSWMVSISAPAA